MIETYPWLSVIPPLVAVVIAIKFRQVYFALFVGLWVGASLLAEGNVIKGFFQAVDRCLDVFKDSSNTRIIIFCIFIGAIVAFVQRSGGVRGFIEMVSKRNLVTTRRRAQLMTVAISSMIPIESSVNMLISGTISRPLYDKLRISREKLAYICDSFSAPICTLIPMNAWGAYVAGLMAEQGVAKSFQVYLMAIPLNFYALLAIGLVIFLIITQKDFFTMAKAERRAREEGKVLRDEANPLISADITSIEPKEGIRFRASNMVVPILTLIVVLVMGLFITGKGDISEGNGSMAVFYAVIAAILIAGLKYQATKIMSFHEMLELFFKGVGGLIPLAFLITISFALSKLCSDMETGIYVAGVTKHLISPVLLPAILFVVTGFIAFATGTSWGAWAIMFPIGLGFVHALDLNIYPIVGALMSGGVFGDHCSPISDTTIVASMASASDHIDHVNTQLPYALTVGGMTIVCLLIVGLIVY